MSIESKARNYGPTEWDALAILFHARQPVEVRNLLPTEGNCLSVKGRAALARMLDSGHIRVLEPSKWAVSVWSAEADYLAGLHVIAEVVYEEWLDSVDDAADLPLRVQEYVNEQKAGGVA